MAMANAQNDANNNAVNAAVLSHGVGPSSTQLALNRDEENEQPQPRQPRKVIRRMLFRLAIDHDALDPSNSAYHSNSGDESDTESDSELKLERNPRSRPMRNRQSSSAAADNSNQLPAPLYPDADSLMRQHSFHMPMSKWERAAYDDLANQRIRTEEDGFDKYYTKRFSFQWIDAVVMANIKHDFEIVMDDFAKTDWTKNDYNRPVQLVQVLRAWAENNEKNDKKRKRARAERAEKRREELRRKRERESEENEDSDFEQGESDSDGPNERKSQRKKRKRNPSDEEASANVRGDSRANAVPEFDHDLLITLWSSCLKSLTELEPFVRRGDRDAIAEAMNRAEKLASLTQMFAQNTILSAGSK